MAYNNVYKTKFLLPRIYVAGVGVISTSESAPATWPGGLRRDGVSVCSSPRLSPGQVQSCLLSVPGGTDQAKCQVTCLLNKRCELWRSQAQELPWERSPTGQGAFTPKTLFALFGQKSSFTIASRKAISISDLLINVIKDDRLNSLLLLWCFSFTFEWIV